MVILLVLFSIYLLTMCPTVHWLDGGGLVVAGFALVPAHPPGESVYIMLAHLASMFPFGNIAFRINVLSAISAAAAAWLTIIWLESMLEAGQKSVQSTGTGINKFSSDPATSQRTAGSAASSDEVFANRSNIQGPSLAVLMAAAFLIGPVWIQAVRVEVYSLSFLLTVGQLVLLSRGGLPDAPIQKPWILAAALVFGLNFAVHPLLAALVLLAFVPHAAARAAMWSVRLLLPAAAFAVLGASTCLMVPLRGGADVGWGGASTLQGTLDFLLARTFTRNFSPLTAELLANNMTIICDAVYTACGPIVLLLAAGGILMMARARHWRWLSLLGLLAAANLWSILPQNKVSSDNPDFHGYLMLTYALIWALAVWGTAQLAMELFRLRPTFALLAPGLLLTGSAGAVLVSVAYADRSNDYLAREHGVRAFEGLQPGAILLVSGNNTMFVCSYLQTIEGLRPDVLAVSRTLLSHEWYRQRVNRGEAWARAAVGPAHTFAAGLAPTPVRVELRPVDLEGVLALEPAPAPGWGYFDVLTPSRGSLGGRRTELDGLPLRADAAVGPEAMVVGINAWAFLADYNDARGLSQESDKVRQRMKKIVPDITLARPE